MKLIIILGAYILFPGFMIAQELFVFTEPASNMPTQSVSAKLTFRAPFVKYYNTVKQRYTPELMYGISKQLMVHVSSTFSDFYSSRVSWESVKLYGKWRFFLKMMYTNISGWHYLRKDRYPGVRFIILK